MKYLLLTFAILSIASQIPHSFWYVDYISNLEGHWKRIQNIVFCAIIATAILVCVLMGLHVWAAVGVLVESVINIYYVHSSYADLYKDGRKNRDDRKRKLVGAYFLAVLIPLCVYLFSYLYITQV